MHDLGPSSAGQSVPNALRPEVPRQPRRATLLRWFDSWMRSLGMALVLFLVIKTFLLEAFQIPSGSMERTLLAGDFLFVNKAVYGAQIPGTDARLPAFGEPQRGDVIVFEYPRDPDINFVKRLIGLPGDTVEMRAGELLVNGERQAEPYVQRLDPWHDGPDRQFLWQWRYLVPQSRAAQRRYHPTRDTWGPLAVPAGKYFVLGDNRDYSLDSRYWGFVDKGAVKGRPLLVYFSYDRGTRDALPWLTDIRWRRLGSLVH